jgi:hypothetical protein
VLDLRPARAEIGFGARPAVAARSLIDLALLLGGRLRHRRQLHSLVSGLTGTTCGYLTTMAGAAARRLSRR